jgi:hypothetical protein
MMLWGYRHYFLQTLLCLPNVHHLAAKTLLEALGIPMAGKAQHRWLAAVDYRTFDQVGRLLHAHHPAVEEICSKRQDAGLLLKE